MLFADARWIDPNRPDEGTGSTAQKLKIDGEHSQVFRDAGY